MHKTLKAPARSSPYKWCALAILVLIAAFNYLDRVSLYILQVQIKDDLHLSDAQLGLLTGVAFSLVYTAVGVPIARLADRTVRKTLIAAAVTVWSAMTALCGLANGFGALALLRMGVAVGEAGSLPASHSIIADYFPRDRRATALALWTLSFPIGQMAGYGLSGWLAAAVGWRGAFLVLGSLGLCLGPLVMFALKEPQRGATDGVAPAAVVPPPLSEALRSLWRMRALRHVFAGAALTSYVLYVIINWSAPFYSRVHGFSMARLAGGLVLQSGLGTGVGMLLGGILADRLAKRDIRWRLRVPMIGALGMAPLMLIQFLTPDAGFSLAVGVLTLLFGNAFYAPVVACAQSMAPANLRALTSSITVVSMNLFGMSLGPVVTGLISDGLRSAYGMTGDSLRYAIAVSAVLAPWAAFHFYRAAQLLPRESQHSA